MVVYLMSSRDILPGVIDSGLILVSRHLDFGW